MDTQLHAMQALLSSLGGVLFFRIRRFLDISRQYTGLLFRKWIASSPRGDNRPEGEDLYCWRRGMRHSILTRSVSEGLVWDPRLRFGLVSAAAACSITGARRGVGLGGDGGVRVMAGSEGDGGVSAVFRFSISETEERP